MINHEIFRMIQKKTSDFCALIFLKIFVRYTKQNGKIIVDGK